MCLNSNTNLDAKMLEYAQQDFASYIGQTETDYGML